MDVAKDVLRSGMAARADWRCEMAFLRQFGTDFYARAGAETRVAYGAMLAEGGAAAEAAQMLELRYGHIPDFRDARIPAWTETTMTPKLLEEWCRTISVREFRVQALVALQSMWKGAMGLIAPDGNPELVPCDQVLNFVDGCDFRVAR